MMSEDYRDKLRQYQKEQGFEGRGNNPRGARDNRGGYSGRDSGARRPPVRNLPAGYLEEGYLEKTQKNNVVIQEDLLLEHAESIGKSLAQGRGSDTLKYSQLRKFYDYAVNCDNKLKLCNDFELVKRDILKLSEFANYANSRKNIPEVFRMFIQKNIETIKTENDFRKGFLEHFQAVVAYYKYYRPNND